MIKEINLYVENMTCRNCVKILRNALSPISGILKITIELSKKDMLIQYDSEKVVPEQIMSIINAKGYICVDTT